MAEVISISNATRVHSYRGVLIITDKLSVEAGSRVSLSDYVSDGGTSDVFTICRLLDAQWAENRLFQEIVVKLLKFHLTVHAFWV